MKMKDSPNLLEEGEHSGFSYFIMHNTTQSRCGYVVIPPNHPWYKKGESQFDADVHGGITYTDADENGNWIIGFDCGHWSDAPDPSLPGAHPMNTGSGIIRTQEYVRAECKSLCEQANEVWDLRYFVGKALENGNDSL